MVPLSRLFSSFIWATQGTGCTGSRLTAVMAATSVVLAEEDWLRQIVDVCLRVACGSTY